MVFYRRNWISGGTYFFTVTLADRRSQVLIKHLVLLREAFRCVRRERPFRIDVVVVLPDHLHTIWSLPEGDSDYPGRWRAIKSRFTRAVRERDVPLISNTKGEYNLWQRRYWEHTIRDEDDLQRHVDYIHYNPVKHGLVKRVADWPYSSFHRYVRLGRISPDWGSDVTLSHAGNFGE